MDEILWSLFAIWLFFVLMFFVIAGAIVTFFIWVWRKIISSFPITGKKRF